MSILYVEKFFFSDKSFTRCHVGVSYLFSVVFNYMQTYDLCMYVSQFHIVACLQMVIDVIFCSSTSNINK